MQSWDDDPEAYDPITAQGQQQHSWEPPPARRKDQPAYAFLATLGRAAIASPVMLLGLALCLTFVGIPLGFPILLGTSLWITKPLRRLPQNSIYGDAN